jgi:hypothetical protein
MKDTYLLPFACDGIPDCEDGSDEIESACGQVCADKVLVTAGDAPMKDAEGVYDYMGQMIGRYTIVINIFFVDFYYLLLWKLFWRKTSLMDTKT